LVIQLGDAAVLHAAHQISLLKAVVTIGAPYHPQHVLHLFEAAKEEMHQSGRAVVQIGG
jgi:putative redox protein